MAYLDTVFALQPATFFRPLDAPTNGGLLENLAYYPLYSDYANPTTLTFGSLDIPNYGTSPPGCLVFPNSQASSNRMGGATNTVWDRGSSDRPCSAFVWAKRVTTPSVNFPSILSIGDTTNGFTVYLGKAVNRVDMAHRAGGVNTGGSGTGFTWSTNSWALVGWRMNPTTGWQINVNGVDLGSRINPAKWNNGIMAAQFRVGTWGTGEHWEGSAGDAAFFDYELTASQMLGVYNAGTATVTGGGGGGGGTAGFQIASGGVWVGGGS